MQDEHSTATESVPYVSESFGNNSDTSSESLGTFPKEDDYRFRNNLPTSERNDSSFPNASASFGNSTPSASETLDEIMSRPPRLPEHTLTAREVEKLFDQAGRPVTERSILNWCKPNSEGICRLNCGYERSERRWYIAADSVERVIEEERKRDQSFPKESLEFSEASERLSEGFGKEQPSASESFGNVRKEEAHSFGKIPNTSERREDSLPKAPVGTSSHQASERVGDHVSERGNTYSTLHHDPNPLWNT